MRRMLAVLLVVAGITLGCSSTDSGSGGSTGGAPVTTDPGPAKRGGAISVGVGSEPDSLHPSTGRFAPASFMIARAIFDPIVVVDTDGKTVPYLVEKFEPNTDASVWTITTREGVRFHDGASLDADALRVNFEAMRTSPLSSGTMTSVEDVKVVDERTLQITMKSAWPSFPNLLVGQLAFIESPKQITDGSTNREAVGTGPFQLRNWGEDGVTVRRNDSYWQKAPDGDSLPYLDEVDFKIIGDDSSRVYALDAGDVDLMHGGVPEVVNRMRSERPDRISIDSQSSDKGFLAFNTALGDLGDQNIRIAAAAAFDREAALGVVSAPAVANGPIRTGFGSVNNYPAYDVERARSLVEDFKRANGRAPKIRLVTTAAAPTFLAMGQYIQQAWNDVGIEASIDAMGVDAFVPALVTGNFDAILFSYWAESDPDTVAPYFLSSSITEIPAISLNFSRFANSTIDDAFAEGRAATDPAARAKAYQKAWDVIGEQVTILWLYENEWVVAWDEAIHGVDALTVPGEPSKKVEPNRWGAVFLTTVWKS